MARTQDMFGVREQSRQADSSCPDVNLAVREIELAFVRINNPVGENQLEIQQVLGGPPVFERWKAARVIQIFLLAGGEVDLDRINRGDRRDGAARRTHQRPDL